MTDEPFFLTVSGISMSFVAFAGLMNALRGGGEWQAIHLYQLRIIVAYAVATLFAALLVIPVSALVGQRDAVTGLGILMTIVSVVFGLGNMAGDVRLGRARAVSTGIRAAFAALTALGSVAFVVTALSGRCPRTSWL